MVAAHLLISSKCFVSGVAFSLRNSPDTGVFIFSNLYILNLLLVYLATGLILFADDRGNLTFYQLWLYSDGLKIILFCFGMVYWQNEVFQWSFKVFLLRTVPALAGLGESHPNQALLFLLLSSFILFPAFFILFWIVRCGLNMKLKENMQKRARVVKVAVRKMAKQAGLDIDDPFFIIFG